MNTRVYLHEVALTTPTDYWNDSCSIPELKYAIERGAVGATTNPVIVGYVLKKDMDVYKDRILQMIHEMPHATEDEIAWLLNEEMAVEGASVLEPIYNESKGQKGRISIQTNTKYYRSPELLIQQTLHFNKLAPNIQVKMPVTKAGIKAFEEATYHGVSINATVSFTLPQALAVAEAVERGLKRREAEGKDTSWMHPVCTIMLGRLDDWLKECVSKEGIVLDPEALEWAGIAVMKRAYEIYKEKGYRTQLLGAAQRNHYHVSALIGDNIAHTIPYKWQTLLNNSDVKVESTLGTPVNPSYIEQMLNKLPDFRRAYEPDGLTEEEFEHFGSTVKTLKQFTAGYDELVGIIRNFMIV